MRTFYVYMMTNKTNGVLYTGVTNDLWRRVAEHQEGLIAGFTKKYKIKKLVYYEDWQSIRDAIEREKRIKGWTRRKKNDLIESLNATWKDLSDPSA